MKYLLSLFVSLLLFSCGIEQETQIDLPLHSGTDLSEKSTILATSSSYPEKNFASPWSVDRRILRGGKQEGVEILTLDNGKLQIRVIPTRGMGILDVNMLHLLNRKSEEAGKDYHTSCIFQCFQSGNV